VRRVGSLGGEYLSGCGPQDWAGLSQVSPNSSRFKLRGLKLKTKEVQTEEFKTEGAN
jgi:hypothetical protein